MANRRFRLTLLPGSYAISRAAPGAAVPDVGGGGSFVSITRTADELSIVADEAHEFSGFSRLAGWRCLKVIGPLAFDEIGVLAHLSTTLAAAGVSIVAISTWDTDYLLVQDSAVDRAVEALVAAGHDVSSSVDREQRAT